MSNGPHTEDGTPIGGWALRSDPATFDAFGMIAEFGQVWRHPVEPGPLADLMDAGQPCFLIVLDRSRVVGLWALGEVVAPATTITIETPEGEVTEQTFAELELLPLAKGIALEKLAEHRVLAASALVTATDAPNPIVLRPEEVRALEEIEFEIVPPSAEQLLALDEVLGDEDDGLIFQLFATDRSFGILDDGAEDELLAVVTVSDEGALEVGRYETIADALTVVGEAAGALTIAEPVDLDDADAEVEPVALLRVEDGIITLYRTGPEEFELYEPTEDGGAELIARFDSLAGAVAGIAESIEEVDDEGDPEADA